MLKGIKEVLIDIFNLFYKVIYGHARWVLAVVIVIVCAQVFCRNILRTDICWNQEVALLLTTRMALLGTTIRAEKDLYTDVELSYDKSPVKTRSVADMLNRIIMPLVGAFSTVYGVRMVLSTMDSRPPAIKWPSSLMHIVIPVSGVAITYFTVLGVTGLKKCKKTDDAGKFNREGEEKE